MGRWADGRERRVIAETVGRQRSQGLCATEVLGGQQLVAPGDRCPERADSRGLVDDRAPGRSSSPTRKVSITSDCRWVTLRIVPVRSNST